MDKRTVRQTENNKMNIVYLSLSMITLNVI